MKKAPFNLLAFLCLFVFLTCKKEEPLVDSPPKIFKFPFEIKKYKIEIDYPIKVYTKTGFNTKKEITNYDPMILNEPVFKSVGNNVINSIAYESEIWAEYDPKSVNDRMKITKNGNSFSFTVTIGNNTSCHAKGFGDYDDLFIYCQAFCIHTQEGEVYYSDYFEDACSVDQALDCQLNDTVAILNYKIYLRKD